MIAAVVPVKGLASSKSRLLPHLGRANVERLAIAMLGDVVTALRAVPGLECVAVVTPDPRVAVAAEESGARPLLQRYPDLNAALDGSAALLAQSPDAASLVVLGDVAAVQPGDVEALICALEGRGVALAPSRDGGTSALFRSPWNAIRAGFGPGSAAVHRARAAAAGVPYVEVELPSLAIDIDLPSDIAAAMTSRDAAIGARTRAVLETLS